MADRVQACGAAFGFDVEAEGVNEVVTVVADVRLPLTLLSQDLLRMSDTHDLAILCPERLLFWYEHQVVFGQVGSPGVEVVEHDAELADDSVRGPGLLVQEVAEVVVNLLVCSAKR